MEVPVAPALNRFLASDTTYLAGWKSREAQSSDCGQKYHCRSSVPPYVPRAAYGRTAVPAFSTIDSSHVIYVGPIQFCAAAIVYI